MDHRSIVFAVIGLLAAAAALSYAVGGGAGRLTGTVKLRHPLGEAIPAELDGWRSRDEPLTPAVIRMTALDDYVRRTYVSPQGESLLLYVAYHGNKERGMQTYYHNATVCFPSQGWRQTSEKAGVETPPDLAREIPVCRYAFSKAGATLSVLTFFRVDGEFLDQSPRNKPSWLILDRATPQFSDSPGTFAQVQIIADVQAGGEHLAHDLQSRFLRRFGHSIVKSVEDVTE